MPHIIFGYRKKNPLYDDLVEFAVHENYFYALAFLVGFSIAVILLLREKWRLEKLMSEEKLASIEKIVKLRGGFDDFDDKDYQKFLKTLSAVAYLQFLANPVICLKPGHYEVVDPKILKILLSIIGDNVVGPNGIYEPRVINPGIWIMAYVINRLKKPTLTKVGIDAAVDIVKIQKYGQINARDHLSSIIQNWGFQIIVNFNLLVINQIIIRLSPNLSLGVFILNVIQFLAFGLGIGTLSLVGTARILGSQLFLFKQVGIKLLSASLATLFLVGSTRPLVCEQLVRALPSSPTHSEYLLPVPTTAPRNDKDKMIVYVRKVDQPEQQDMLCESRAFSKTLEGQILEASDLTDQTYIIQEQCTKLPGTLIQVTGGIKTRSDVKQHDERPVREETDRNLNLLELKGILEEGNWYGAEKQLEEQLTAPKVNDKPRLRHRKMQTGPRKQTMTLRDLPKEDREENCFVQEETQRVSKLPEKAEKISHQDNYDDDFLI